MTTFFKRHIFKVDWVLLCTAILISASALVTLYTFGESGDFFNKQIIFLGVAIVAFLGMSQIDLQLFRKTHLILYAYIFFICVLLVLFVVGHTAKGAQSWFAFGSFSFQPTDIMKLIVILICAKYFSRRHVEIKRFKHIVISAVYMFIPFVLIFLQPDFGSAIIVFLVWFGMVLVSGLSKKHLIVFSVIGLSLFIILWSFVFKEYQKKRIENFINPTLDVKGTGYNAKQSIIAVGSGQIIGKGIGHGTQSRLHFLPEYQTDFIFAAYAEEWGFVGACFVIILYLILFVRIIMAAIHGATNFETLTAVGIVLFLLSHVLINVGMNIGIMPITGITLPFMSYGGSHLVAEFMALGLVSSISKNRRATHRDNLQYEFLGVE